MTISKPSQATLFAIGSDKPEMTPQPLWMTPSASHIDNDDPLRELRRKANMPGGARKTPTILSSQVSAVTSGLTSSPAAIPANPSRSPGSAWARRMTAISGRSLRRWLPTSSLGAVFSRMFTDTSRWGSTMCWLTWNRSATPAGRSLFRLRPSAPRTGEIASGFWHTPRAAMASIYAESDETRTRHGRTYETLATQVRDATMWPTPRHEGFDAGGHRGTIDSLHSHVKMFPTPRAIYGEHAGMSDPSHLTGAAGASPTTGRLSAAWVSRLMGYPDGWLDLES